MTYIHHGERYSKYWIHDADTAPYESLANNATSK